MRIDDQGAIKAQQQGVAIGFCAGHHLRANVAGGTGLVVDHHLLAQTLRELFCNQATAGIRHASGRERHDQSNGLGRVVALRLTGGGDQP